MSARGALGCGVALVVAALSGCEARGAAPPVELEAAFGVFYGGQVQQRDEIPLTLDANRQRQGFRLRLAPAPSTALEVVWELGRPGTGKRVADARGRRARPREVQLGRAHFRPGEGVFEQALPFSPGDPLGLWNIRVLLGGRVVIDRPFVVYDAAERARRQEGGEAPDAGL